MLKDASWTDPNPKMTKTFTRELPVFAFRLQSERLVMLSEVIQPIGMLALLAKMCHHRFQPQDEETFIGQLFAFAMAM